MSDRIILANMVFHGRHGVLADERSEGQPFEVDVELHLDLRPAGIADDIDQTVDYRDVFDACQRIVEGPSYLLLEALAEAIATDLLTRFEVPEVTVRVRKPRVGLPGKLDSAGIEIHRGR